MVVTTAKPQDIRTIADFIQRVTVEHSGEQEFRSIRVATTLLKFLTEKNVSRHSNLIQDFMDAVEKVSDWKGRLNIATKPDATDMQMARVDLAANFLEQYWCDLWCENNVSINGTEIN